MDVTSATTAPSFAPATAAGTGTAKVTSDFETFLRMLTVQIQNQDPLNPMESTEFAEQLATFSTVEQQVRTNDLLAGLGAQMNLMGLSQLSGWVGREARVAAPASWTPGDTPIELFPNPPVRADRVELVVRDATGAEVYRKRLPEVSLDPVQWNGTDTDGVAVEAGQYSFSLDSFTADVPIISQPLERYAAIEEARTDNGSTFLILEGGVRVMAADVKGLRDPA
jgi:flagellar basal-body rod modification protein FlgD